MGYWYAVAYYPDPCEAKSMTTCWRSSMRQRATGWKLCGGGV
jgi:hypothetical protein